MGLSSGAALEREALASQDGRAARGRGAGGGQAEAGVAKQVGFSHPRQERLKESVKSWRGN